MAVICSWTHQPCTRGHVHATAALNLQSAPSASHGAFRGPSTALQAYNNSTRPISRSFACNSSGMQQQQHGSVPHEQLLEVLKGIVPQLNNASHKGQSGKVGVVGGCREYTGAPFFAAMSAMRMGVDLAYVFCTPSAAPVIKGYSPELIVMPMLADRQRREAGTHNAPGGGLADDWYWSKCVGFIERLSVLIIGPGLGDDEERLEEVLALIAVARKRNLPLIIDGSGLSVIAPHLKDGFLKGYSNCILTPNIAELGRLAQGAGVALEGPIGTQWQQHASEVAAALEGPLILSKGQVDIITNGQQQLVVTADGSPRRCGGQGDVLTGTMASFISWQAAAAKQQQKQQQPPAAAAAAVQITPLMLAAYGGCLTMRAAAVLTYARKGRSMVAGDMIEALGDPVLQQAGLLPGPSTKL